MTPLHEAVRPTTIIRSSKLRDHLGLDITIVSEAFQHTGSFKFRAAYNLALNVPNDSLLAASSGNFGQVIRKNYPVAVGNRMTGAPDSPAYVVGPLCTPLDLLADKMDLAHAEVGDLIVVFQSGAYGLSASPGAFLSHPAAAEVLV